MPEGRLPSSAFAYVETDIPPGMTLPEWRAHRAAHAPRRRTRGPGALVAAALALVGRVSGSRARAGAADAASSGAVSTDRVPAITDPTATAADRRGLRWRGDAGAEQSTPDGLPIPKTRRPGRRKAVA